MDAGIFQIYKTKDCPSGYAYVRDYQLNLVFYGPIEECQSFIDNVTGFGGRFNVSYTD